MNLNIGMVALLGFGLVAAETAIAVTPPASPFLGTYQGFSRACENSILVLGPDTLRLDECRGIPYEVLEQDEHHVLIAPKPTHGCGLSQIQISIEGPPRFGGYRVESAGATCSYGRVDPSMAEDQSEQFLSAKSAKARAGALHKMNLQGRSDRNKFNEIGLRDPSPEVRDIAAFFLRGDAAHFVPLLLNVAATDADYQVRLTAILSVGSFYTSNGSDLCGNAAPLRENENYELLKSLRSSFGQEAAHQINEILTELYECPSN